MTDTDVLVIGAGVAGLVAARALLDAGRDVTVLDKGRSVGGRLATRRIGDARLDHGAQFFTARGDPFAELVERALGEGAVHEWCRGFGDAPDGHPRYAGSAGMNGFAKWLASGIEVQTSVQLSALRADHGWWIAQGGNERWRARSVIATPPVPQTLALLAAGSTELGGPVAERLEAVRYFSTLALLVTLDRPGSVPEPGGVQQDETEPFTFIGDNRSKGVSPAEAITFHANHGYSRRRYDDDEAEVLAELVALAQPWLGDARVVEAQLKRWRYAGPHEPLEERVLTDVVDGAPIAFAGDAFGGPKVEGAFESGRAAAAALGGR